jgi:hypothetical protein
MSPSAPSQPIELRPPRLILLRDKSLAKLTHIVDGPEPYELLGSTVAEAGRAKEPLLWRADGHYAAEAQSPHYLDIVGIELIPDQPTDGGAVFAPFTGLKFKKS